VGITQLRHLQPEQLPEFKPTMVEVRTEALGLSAAEVEQLITVPLEHDLLNGVAFLDEIYSESRPGLSSVVMIFEPGTDLLDARQVVAEKVSEAAVALPAVSTPPQMLQPLSSTSRVLMARLSSQELSPIEMSVLARWVINPRLLSVDGVANVSVWGFRDQQLQVLVDPERLRQRGVTLQQIISTTGNALWVSPLTFLEASTPGTAGWIDTQNQRLAIRHILPIDTAEELAQVPVDGAGGEAVTVDGETLRLGDVAQVVEDHQPLIGDALFREGSGLLLVVEKFPGANTVEVTREVEEALAAMRPGLGGMEIDTTLFRPATYIETSIGNLSLALLAGGILLMLILALILFEWRTVVISVVAIALSLVTAGMVLYLLDASANMLVVAGLVMAVGVVIADAVTDAENLAARVSHAREEHPGSARWQIILEGSLEMRSAMVYAVLIVLAALVPAFFMEGPAGAFLPPLALSFAVAVAASMAVALTVTPALAMFLLPAAGTERRGSPVIRRLGRGHDRVLSRVVRRPGWAYLALGVIGLAGIATLPFLERSLSPTLKESNLLIRWEAPPGTSLPEMNRVTTQAVRELGALDGIGDVSAHVGRAINSDQVVGINSGEIWVDVDPSADYEATVAAIDRTLSGYPGLSHDVLTYPEEKITDVFQGTGQDVVVRIYGENAQVRRTKAAEVRSLLTEIEGITRPTIELPAEEPTLEVEVDVVRAQRHGVKPGDVRRAAATLLSGVAVGNLFEELKVFDVVVWGTPDIRQNVSDVRELLIDVPGGRQVRLEDVAEVRIASNPTVIRHESVASYVDVTADVVGRSVPAAVEDVRRALDRVSFPLEHHAELLGTYAQAQAAGFRLVTVAVAAVIGIFLLLQAAFMSWRLALLVFAILPAALAGGALAALVGGGTITIGSVAGFAAVLGIAARDGILLVRRYQDLEREGALPFGEELVLRGTRERLTPVVGCALATGLALLPMVIVGDVAGLEIVRPMAIVMLGGLVTSALLVLLALPSLYLRHGRVRERDTVAEELTITLPEVEPVSESSEVVER
ncbi:MAG TPA: efflux RND transporter permease subunit, partial [Actinomycetota bacterium]|nr:efflux RND transporter permease subunit [Actinomycetota bacterium]